MNCTFWRHWAQLAVSGVCLVSCAKQPAGSSDPNTPEVGGVSVQDPSDPSSKPGGDSPKSPTPDKSTPPEPSPDGPPTPQDPSASEDSDAGESADDEELPSAKFDLGGLPDAKDPEADKPASCDIDFLFVIDNSGSMHDEQKNVVASVPKFIATIKGEIKNLESYQIGVISTDENPSNQGERDCNVLGGLSVQRPGEVCGPYANGLSFLTEADELEEKFSCAAFLGVDGSGNERPMDALFASMSPELTKAGACNEKFFRKDSILAVVLITDEEDDPEERPLVTHGSQGDPKAWHKQLMAFKDNREELVVVLSLIGHEEPNACKETYPTGEIPMGTVEGAEISPRLKAFTELFGKRGSVYDVCAEDYSESFKKAVDVLGSACKNLPPPG